MVLIHKRELHVVLWVYLRLIRGGGERQLRGSAPVFRSAERENDRQNKETGEATMSCWHVSFCVI